MNALLYRLWVFFNQMRTFKAKCGHNTKLKGSFTAYGEVFSGILDFDSDGTLRYCHDCIGKMTIPCAWCGKPIVVGSPITLCSPIKPDYTPPVEGYVTYSEDPLRLVGCLRWDCADSGIYRAGFWVPPGKVKRVASPLELALHVDDVVVVQNLHDMDEARRQTDAAMNMSKKEG